jgi:hypothetical protein
MHSVSVFTMLSYCCRTILCDNDVTKCVQSVDTQAASSSLRSTVHIIMLRHSTSTLYTMYQHCACPLCGPPGESGQHQQVVKLYSHSTKQPCQAKAPARLVGPVLLRSAAGRVGSLGCRAGRLGWLPGAPARLLPGLRRCARLPSLPTEPQRVSGFQKILCLVVALMLASSPGFSSSIAARAIPP